MPPRVLNVLPSRDRRSDWQIDTAIASGLLRRSGTVPRHVDLREPWWSVGDQRSSGSAAGWAAAEAIRWHLVRAGRLPRTERLSARHLWLAARELDAPGDWPSSFFELEGASIKATLEVARRWGVVPDALLPSAREGFYMGDPEEFYAVAARLRIAGYVDLGLRLEDWRRWLAARGPVVVALWVDVSWDRACRRRPRLERHDPDRVLGPHAAVLVGFTAGYLIVRNSWGTRWGDGGFAYASAEYARSAIFEAYGIVV